VSHAATVQVIEPKAVTDRTIIRRAQQRCCELTLGFLEDLEAIARNPKAKDSDRIAAMRVVMAHALPTIQRIDIQGVLANLPMANSERDLERSADPVAAERRAVREALRAICHGREVPPELKLLSANGDG
jgi:hypothetical protein